ncbi:MAG: DUF4292 domain-containing protein [Bdellovibrionales bacterium]|nr:DUF4292 domain-containing protein [Bdellovibrionales bacterium]
MMVRLVIFSVLVIFFTTACQMIPTDYAEYNEGQWGSKVLIKDKVKSKSFIVNVDIQAIKNKSLRMDVTAAMGTPVASLVLNGDQVQYLLFRQKAYYEGASSDRVLGPILSVPIDPKLFFNLLFDEAMTDKNWSCIKDKIGFLLECKNLQDQLKITWKDRKGRRKAIFIEHSKAEIQMNISSFTPHADSVFSLKVPKSFQKYRVR